MKLLILIGLLGLGLHGFAQQKPISEKELPAFVAEGFALAYPDRPECTWEKRNARFVATIKYEDRTEIATFLENGEWAETRVNISNSELPEKLLEFTNSRYDAYRIESAQYVEESGGGNYFALMLALKSNKELTTELIFDLAGDIQMIDGMAVEADSDESIVVKNDTKTALRPGIQKEVIDENKGIPDIILLNIAKRYGITPDKIKWSKTDLGFHRAEYMFREVNMASEWDNDGNQASVITFFTKKTAVYPIQKFLDENYSKASFISGERVVYESKFTRMFPNMGLKSYFHVVISERARGAKTPTFYTVYFDHTGQLDMIVEQENTGEEKE